MGFSTKVTGLRNPNHSFNQMLQIKAMCDKVGISYPDEVSHYFGDHIGQLPTRPYGIEGLVTSVSSSVD